MPVPKSVFHAKRHFGPVSFSQMSIKRWGNGEYRRQTPQLFGVIIALALVRVVDNEAGSIRV